MPFQYMDAPASGGGAPTGPAGGDLAGTYPNPTIGANKVTLAKIAAAVTLDAIAAAYATAADVAMNAHKITGLANGTAATDALAVGQVLAAGAIPIADLADPGAGKVIGSSGGAAAAVTPPGTQLDRVAYTGGSVSVTATTEGTAQTIIDGTSQAYAAATVELVFFNPLLTCPAGNNIVLVFLRDSTVLGQVPAFSNNAAVALSAACTASVQDTPSAATHQYHVKVFVTGGAGTYAGGVGGSGVNVPSTLTIRRV